ncbi:hypothetical protein BDW69DRAFT_60575 [Aspergillus filifer]
MLSGKVMLTNCWPVALAFRLKIFLFLCLELLETVPRIPKTPPDRSSTSAVRENSHSSLSGDRHRALCPPLLRLLEQTENINRRPCRPRANNLTSSSPLIKLT